MKEHSEPPFRQQDVPDMHLFHTTLKLQCKEWGLLLLLRIMGYNLWKPCPNEGDTRWAMQSLLNSWSWIVPVGQCLTPSCLRQEVSPSCSHLHAATATSPSRLVPRKVLAFEPSGTRTVVSAHLVLGAWEPLLAWVNVAISVPPVCCENVRTSPDSLQSQELHCLNLCQLCF